MERRRIIYILVILSIITGSLAYLDLKTSSAVDKSYSNTINNDEAHNKLKCQQAKNFACNQKKNLSSADYPNECFRNGENILEDPYKCTD